MPVRGVGAQPGGNLTRIGSISGIVGRHRVTSISGSESSRVKGLFLKDRVWMAKKRPYCEERVPLPRLAPEGPRLGGIGVG
jgi:hypothetical protein